MPKDLYLKCVFCGKRPTVFPKTVLLDNLLPSTDIFAPIIFENTDTIVMTYPLLQQIYNFLYQFLSFRPMSFTPLYQNQDLFTPLYQNQDLFRLKKKSSRFA